MSSFEPPRVLVWGILRDYGTLNDQSSDNVVSCDLNGSGQLECQLEVKYTLLPFMGTGKIYLRVHVVSPTICPFFQLLIHLFITQSTRFTSRVINT